MARLHTVSFAESAVRDLDEVQAWYAVQGIPDVGERLVGEVLARVDQLAHFAESGRVVPEFEATWLREPIMAPFRIVCRMDDERVRVVHVWRSERLMRDS